MEPTNREERRYDLDWLRVIAFSLLILYHVGMMYVSWGWHIKSEHISTNLEYLMLMLNRWRLPLLFFISGCAIFFASQRRNSGSLLKLRIKRLLPPVIFGILVVVPPQLYYQMIYDGNLNTQTYSYLDFYLNYLDKDSSIFQGYETPLWGHMTWNHLWFVVYLFFFSIAFYILQKLPLTDLSRKLSCNLFPEHRWKLLLLPCIPMVIFGLILRNSFPITYAFFNDWYNNLYYFVFFGYGYWLAKNVNIWSIIERNRYTYLILSLALYCLLTLLNLLPDDVRWIPEWVESIIDVFISYIHYLNTWCWILMLAGFAYKYLNHNSPALKYLNAAVFPYYILHQTITIVIGYPLTQLKLGPVAEPTLIIVGTFIFSALLYEIIRRINILRPLFGLKSLSIPRRDKNFKASH